MLYYVLNVVKLTSDISGFVILSGQIADGITTPIVGFLSDQFDTRFGKRMPWYMGGSLLTYPSFLLLFIYPGFVGNHPINGGTNAFYIIMPAIFNVGKIF